MIKNLKLGVKLLRYTFRIKTSIIVGAVFFSLGLLLLLLPGVGYFAGSTYWMVGGLFVTNTLVSLNASTMVLSSSAKRALQTSIPTVLNLGYCLITYFLFMLFEILLWKVDGREQEPGVLVVYGLLAFILMIYNSYYKIFALAVVFFAITFFWISWGGEQLILTAASQLPLSVAAVIGLAAIMLGALLQYGIALLTYRMPMGKMVINQDLRKLM